MRGRITMLDNSPGLEKFTPTRLDWLLVLLNARFQIEHPFRVYFKTGDDGRSIYVVASHSADVDKKLLEEWIHKAKDIVLDVAASYGWDSWLEVKVDIHKKE